MSDDDRKVDGFVGHQWPLPEGLYADALHGSHFVKELPHLGQRDNNGDEMSDNVTAPMTPDEFADRLRHWYAIQDADRYHANALELLYELLESLGYGEGAGVFASMMETRP
jgi:hypothetical protein